MTDASPANAPSASSIPADDPARVLTVADPDGAGVPHISVAGGTYTILVSGAQTAGRYCLVDMLVPAGAAPAASPRLRGNVLAARRRTRVHFSRKVAHGTRGIDRQRSSERPARV